MMTYFDPTVNWSKVLLDEPIPDLIITRSKTLKDPSVPWRDVRADWVCDWVQYSAAISDDRFLTLTFFESSESTQEDRASFCRYQESSLASRLTVQAYRCLSPQFAIQRLLTGKNSASFNFLAEIRAASVLHCQQSRVRRSPTLGQTWPLCYELQNSSTGSGSYPTDKFLALRPRSSLVTGIEHDTLTGTAVTDFASSASHDSGLTTEDVLVLYAVDSSTGTQGGDLLGTFELSNQAMLSSDWRV